MRLLSERAASIQTVLLDRGRQQAGLQATQRLTQQKERVDSCLRGINAALDLERRLADVGVVVAPPDKPALEGGRKARKNLRTAATKLEDTSLDDGETVAILDGSALGDGLRAAETLVDRAAARIGRALISEREAALPADLEDPIPEVPGHAARQVKLENARRRLLSPIEVTRMDLSPEGIESILAARQKRIEDIALWREEHRILSEALASENPEFRRFLLAAADPEGAPISLLTAGVLDRLANDGLLDVYRVRRG